MSWSRKDWIALAAAWAAVLLVYLPPLFSGKALVDDPSLLDVSFSIMPFFHWMGEAYCRGQFPLWNPHILFGMPLLGYPHSSSLYPPAVLLYTLLPYLYASSFNIILHSLIASCLVYALMKDLEVTPALAAAATVVYLFSGWYFGTIYVLYSLGSVNGMLLLWLSLRHLLRKPSFGWWITAAWATAWASVSGDLELFALGIIGILLTSLLTEAGKLRISGKRFLAAGAAILLGGLISSALALPTLENMHHSVRGALFPFPMNFFSAQVFNFGLLPTWFSPLLSAKKILASSAYNGGLSPLYQGFLTPALFVVALIILRNDRETRAMAAAIAFFLCLIMFKEFTFFGRHVLERVPLLNFSQMPEKSAYFFHALILAMIFRALSKPASGRTGSGFKPGLALALLAGGMVAMASRHLALGGPERYFLGGAACVLGALALWPVTGLRALTPSRLAFAAGMLLAAEVFSLAVRYVPHTDPARFGFNPALDQFARSLNTWDRYAVFEDLLAAAPKAEPPIFGEFEVRSRALNIVAPQRMPPGRSILFSSLIYKDMFYTNPSGATFFNNWTMTNPGTLDRGEMHLFNLAAARIIVNRDKSVPFSSPYSLARLNSLAWKRAGPAFGTPAADALILIRCPVRLYAPLVSEPGDQLKIQYRAGPSAPGAWLGVMKNSGTESAEMVYRRFSGPGQEQTAYIPLSAFGQSPATLSLEFLPGLDQSEVKVASMEIVNPSRPWQRVGAWANVEAFENRDSLPRAFVSREVAVVSGLQNLANWIRDRSRFSPPQQVVLEKDYPEAGAISPLPPEESALEKIEITSYAANRVEMDAHLRGPGVLVFTDSYFPGWKLFDRQAGNLKELRIIPANLAFRAVFLDQGEHQLEWAYQPISFRIGLWASISFLFSTALIIICLRRSPKAET